MSELSKREGECFVQKADKIIWIIRRKEKVSKKIIHMMRKNEKREKNSAWKNNKRIRLSATAERREKISGRHRGRPAHREIF